MPANSLRIPSRVSCFHARISTVHEALSAMMWGSSPPARPVTFIVPRGPGKAVVADDLPGDLLDGAAPAIRVHPGVGGDPFHGEGPDRASHPRRDDRTVRPGGFENQRRRSELAGFFDQGTRGGVPPLLVGVVEDDDSAEILKTLGHERVHRIEAGHEPALHVHHPGPASGVAAGGEGALRRRPLRENRVAVADEKNLGFLRTRPPEAHRQVISRAAGAGHAIHVSADGVIALLKVGGDFRRARARKGGRIDGDDPPEVLDHLLVTRLEFFPGSSSPRSFLLSDKVEAPLDRIARDAEIVAALRDLRPDLLGEPDALGRSAVAEVRESASPRAGNRAG